MNKKIKKISFIAVGIAVFTASVLVIRAVSNRGSEPFIYLKFDEGYGTTTQDATANNNDGTISGASWAQEDDCITGKCLYFDGDNDYVNIPDFSLE